ncbi:MAG: tripartite tricarboxylate transporter permease [archaeon]
MILLWCLLGAGIGLIAGLIPGLHSNNIAVILAATPFFGKEITAFMLSLCITQAFTEFIPAVFIGAPGENTFESILPAHRMLMQGKAFEAICLTTTGALTAVIAGSLLTPLFFMFIEQNSQQIIAITPIVLIAALIMFIAGEQTIKKKLVVIFVIIAAASQGILFKEQVFPLITGYFGIAGTLYSLKEKPFNAKQNTNAEINPKIILDSLIGITGGAIVSIMPGIGSNTAAGIINLFRKTKSTEKYLAMLGAINASNFFFSYATMLALDKARNGTMLALQEKIFHTTDTLFLGTIIMVTSAGIGGLAAIILAKKAIILFEEKVTQKMSIATIILMIILVGFFNGITGLTAMVFATSLGLFTIISGIRRSTCMSSLIVPVLFFYVFTLI